MVGDPAQRAIPCRAMSRWAPPSAPRGAAPTRPAGRPLRPIPRASSARRPRRCAARRGGGPAAVAQVAHRAHVAGGGRGCGRSAPRASAAWCPGLDGGGCGAARARARRPRWRPPACRRAAAASPEQEGARRPARRAAIPPISEPRPRRALLGRGAAAAGIGRQVAAEARRADAGPRAGARALLVGLRARRRAGRGRVEGDPADAAVPDLDPRVGVEVAHHVLASSWCRASPSVKPVTTRAGTPAIRSSSAIAPENCWQ